MTMILIIIYNIYIKRSSQSLQVDGRKWSCKSVSAVTGRRAVLYKMGTKPCYLLAATRHTQT
jgi:hypothetical protein